MAKKQISIEESLWNAADKLRGSVETSQYKHVVLSLIFLKNISDKFKKQRQKLIDEGRKKYIDKPVFYNKDNVFYLDEESRWEYLIENAKQPDIALKIDTALSNIEKLNDDLKGALPNNYFTSLELESNNIASLLDEINNIRIPEDDNDFFGRIYEYFLSKFAIKEASSKGEFYTPKSIVNLIAEILEPHDGILYDPCCGSGGMFVQSYKLLESHHGDTNELSIYGQEYTSTTLKLAKMNLAIRGIKGNLGDKAANTFFNDQHPDLKADYIMANPPFNQKKWRASEELTKDPRWDGYEVPPTSNANYGWILHMVSKLSVEGIAGFLLSNGSLSDKGAEYKIRKQLIENDLVEAILILPRKLFYTTDISVSLWIINKNKKEKNNFRDRTNEILFLDLRQMGAPFDKKYVQLTQEDRDKVVSTINTWRSNIYNYEDISEFCYSAELDEIKEKDYVLVPSRYIEFVDAVETLNFDEKMSELKNEFVELYKEEQDSKDKILKLFEELGHEIKL
ncbi:N-6 DNA methylase [Methanobrevibacter sp.]|uniref:type I restriction-modification system subunit M n=1 Tax=Methanobrevibacter sp. TaxID=66852 RepID=UPI003F7358F1